LDPNAVGAAYGRGGVDPLRGLLRTGLGFRGRGHKIPRGIEEEKIVVVRALGPGVPGEVEEDAVARVRSKGHVGIVPAVGVRVGEGGTVMPASGVPGGLDPKDSRARRAVHNLGQRSCPIVEVRVEPAERMDDDVHPFTNAVGDSVIEVHLVGDLHEVEGGAGSDVVDDLCHRGAVGKARIDSGSGEVAGEDGVREVTAGLGGGEAGKSHVDYGDFYARAGDPPGRGRPPRPRGSPLRRSRPWARVQREAALSLSPPSG
jgi:hypothetical protein